MLKHCVECSCILGSKVSWKTCNSAQVPISWDLLSHGTCCSAATALGTQLAETWAAARSLVDFLAQTPAREEEGGEKQHKICRQLLSLQQPAEEDSYTAWVG